jgi:glucose/arabinose dehydrogenase
VKVLVGRRIRARAFLDIRNRVSAGGERGLLSIAFHPNYAKNRRFFVYYTDTAGDTRVVEYRSNGTTALAGNARLLLFEKQPYSNHNGGQLLFGPDGLLYIGLGDGGSGGDPHNNGQTLRTKLAKIWKLNVDKRGAKPQMVAYGLRNPWRFSFDRANGDLYIGDVGQGEWEEIDYVVRGDRGVKNFGWAAYEGNERFDSRGLLPGGKLVFPIAVYSHDEGCSVTGGFVYRGRERPDLRGRYIYGDYCSGNVWTLRVQGGKAVDVRRESFTIPQLTSFGEDNDGGLYAVSHSGRIFRLAG